MTYNQEATIKVTNTQLNELKSTVKKKAGTKLRITKKKKLKNCHISYL